MDANKTGSFISELRKEKGLTQIALAERLNVSNRAVSKWENGDGLPDITILPTLAQALGITIDELLTGERAFEERPKPIFINESMLDEKDLASALKKYINGNNSNFTSLTLGFYILMMSITLWNLDFENKSLFIFIFVLLFSFMVLIKLWIPKMNAKRLVHDRESVFNSTVTRYEFAESIYASAETVSQIINYGSISAFYETKELFVIKLGIGHFISIKKDCFILGDADSFREFIKGKVNTNKRDIRLKRRNITISVIMLAMTVALIPPNIILYSIKSEQYKPADIQARFEYFIENKKEFDRALEVINSDEEIKKSIEEHGYSSYESDDYIALREIYFIEAGEGYTEFSTEYKTDCMSGYVYYEGDNIPYPYQIGYDHGDIENQGFNYISEDDLYLLGKTENDRSNARDWYLIKQLDDNWFYYEYH